MRNLDLNDPALLQESLVISASAGSGKTFTLSVLVTAHLGQGRMRPFEIVGTTFSEAAAADLRERLLRPLDLLASLGLEAWEGLLTCLGEPHGQSLSKALKELPLPGSLAKAAEEVRWASVHWGEAPWRRAPKEAQAFWRKTRREAELLQVSTLHGLALLLLRQGEGSPETILDPEHPALLRLLRQALREAFELPPEHPDHAPAHTLLAWAESNWEALSKAHDAHRDALGHLQPEDLGPLRAALLAALEGAEASLAPFAAAPHTAKDEGSRSRHHFKAASILPIPGPAASLAQRIRWANRQSHLVLKGKDTPPDYCRTEFTAALERLGPVADAWEAWLRAVLVEGLRRFEQAKVQQGLASFGDLVRRALESLRSGAATPLRPKLLLVDEYQDTSRAQDAFLAALEAGLTVRVGDLKQAIYGFRGGSPELLHQHLVDARERAFRLPTNFRSAEPVVALANHFVDEVWPRLDPGAPALDGHQAAASPGGSPIGLLRTPGPSQGTDLPALADWIAALSLEAAWQQSLGPGSPGPRRRALLLRQRTKLPALLQRLKRRGIRPYVLAKEGFWDSPGVRLVLAGLEAVAHPERGLPCATLLRQLLGLSDAELTALLIESGGHFPGLGALDPDALPATRREAVLWLKSLQGAGTQQLVGELLAQGGLLMALEALAAHGGLEPLRARRNLAGLLGQILTLPSSPAAAFTLLDELRHGVARGDLPATAQEADLIIQTAHGSKGLEYHDVLLPLLNANPQAFRRGELRTDPASGALCLAWKLGDHPGAAYRQLKPLAVARQRRDDLNLLYVALTRARERMCLLLQEAPAPSDPASSKTWSQWGEHLTEGHPELRVLSALPLTEAPAPPQPSLPRALLPKLRLPIAAPSEGAESPARSHLRLEGEAMHAYLRDLLVRWEDAAAFQACLDAPPRVSRAREIALEFLARFEAEGWRPLRRRSEFPLPGAAASGGLGRADLVVWKADRIQLFDFKHSDQFGPEELLHHRAQLQRYAAVLEATEGLPVQATLVALKTGQWLST